MKLLFCIILAFSAPTVGYAFDHSHSKLDQVLRQYVKNGRVDYSALQKRPQGLRQYLREVGSVSQAKFNSWTEAQQIAFLINVYNAETLELIIDNYPLDSIKDLGSLFSSAWKKKVVILFGKKEHLDHVEHELLRKNYKEPRVHFALVCASIGCPELAADAYTAEQLNEQLDKQGRVYFARSDINRVNAGKKRVYLSKIFDWFEEDFGDSDEEVIKFVKPYFPTAAGKALEPGFTIKYSSYDWSLNDI